MPCEQYMATGAGIKGVRVVVFNPQSTCESFSKAVDLKHLGAIGLGFRGLGFRVKSPIHLKSSLHVDDAEPQPQTPKPQAPKYQTLIYLKPLNPIPEPQPAVHTAGFGGCKLLGVSFFIATQH